MDGQAILITAMIAAPPFVAALASWRSANKAVNQTNGQLHDKLDRMENKIDDLSEWQGDHIHRWHN
jgi:uncharacterized protein YukE